MHFAQFLFLMVPSRTNSMPPWSTCHVHNFIGQFPAVGPTDGLEKDRLSQLYVGPNFDMKPMPF